MPGRQAKLLSDEHLTNLVRFAQASRYPARNRLIVLLSFKAGLRAAEIANLTWAMVVDATGAIAPVIELHDQAAKNRGGRRIPVHPDLYIALSRWRDLSPSTGFVITSERGDAMRPRSIVNWFAYAYGGIGLEAARPIRAAAPSSRGQPGWSTGQVARSGMCSCWQVIGRC